MASIPIYQKQVDEQGLPGVRQQSIASPQLFDTTGGLQQAGQGIASLGNAVAKHAEELQQKQDTATGTQMSADFLNQITDYKIAARKRQGDLAQGLPEDAQKFYSDTTDAIIKAAPNDKVKQYLQVFAQQQLPGFHFYIGTHAAEQLDKAEAAGLDAHIVSLKNAAAVDPTQADASVEDITAAVRTQLNKQGITDPEAITQATLEQTTSLHAGVINTLLLNDPKAAAAYYGTHKDQLTGDSQVKIQKTLEVSGRAQTAQMGADKLMDSVRLGSMTYDQAEAEARKTFSGDDRNAVIQELRSQHSEFVAAKQENEKAQFDPVNKMLGDYTLAGRAIPKSEMQKVLQPLMSSPDTYAKAAKLLDQHNDEIRSEANAATDRAKSLASSSTDKALAGLQLKYDILQNPDKWRNADLATTLLPLVKDGTLRASDAQDAINMQTQLKKPVRPPELATLVSASDYLNSRLETAIIDGKAVAKMNTSDKGVVKATALQILEPMVQDYQRRTGEKASTADVKKIVDSIFVGKKYRDTFVGITYGGVKTQTEADFVNAPLRVQSKIVDSIPSNLRARIETALKTNGYPVTPENILEAYQAGKK